MKKKHLAWGAAGALAAAGLAVGAFQYAHVEAADHLDPPARTNPMADPPGTDRAADIADIFAWHTGTGATATLTTALTFEGPNEPAAGQALSCDPDVIYGIHIDNNADTTADFDIEARFAEDDAGHCFVQVSGVPGAAGPIVVPTDRTTQRGDVQLFAGLRSDPFFFDLIGFRETLMTGTVAITNDRDFFFGKNDSALVLEFPLPVTLGSGDSLQVWATTDRVGG